MRGRIPPGAIFPAGSPDIRVRSVTLSDGVTLRVAESGDVNARAVLLLHGWGASIYMWRDWFAPIAAMGLRAIAVDLPGHGLSDKPDDEDRYTLGRLVQTMEELIAREQLHEPHVVAQSMAGTITLEIVLRDRVALGRVALVNPAYFGRIRMLALARRVSPGLVEPVLERIAPRWVVSRAHRMVYGDPSRITSADIDQYWAPSQFPGYARAMRRLIHQFAWQRPSPADMADRLRSIPARSAPLFVVLGTLDRLVRSARPYVAELCRLGAPLTVYESVGGGHAVNEERPEEIVPAVMRFLTGNA